MPSLNVPTDIDGADGYDEFSPNFPLVVDQIDCTADEFAAWCEAKNNLAAAITNTLNAIADLATN